MLRGRHLRRELLRGRHLRRELLRGRHLRFFRHCALWGGWVDVADTAGVAGTAPRAKGQALKRLALKCLPLTQQSLHFSGWVALALVGGGMVPLAGGGGGGFGVVP